MKTYWEGKGKNQKVYDRLYKKLVPAEGEASTKHGELLRQVSKIYYDSYNNGLCNADILAQNALDVFGGFEEEIKKQLDYDIDYDNMTESISEILGIQISNKNDEYMDYKELVDELIERGWLEVFTDAVIDVVSAYDNGYIK